ncbi:Kef-type K+ transport membrane component, putative [Babesia ovata]|uniref:Kef-type K+ transport membrane component, putative n=1 Tax=Babesia ovata TaxID=189622 RepID=A0A2H6KIV4_9APIC|nr:Kef-type K+ transport membrane component, putative [Babesia ovata]GBE62925.1 Kef-type K+ transport membrane component, putative [Babesia ovata]
MLDGSIKWLFDLGIKDAGKLHNLVPHFRHRRVNIAGKPGYDGKRSNRLSKLSIKLSSHPLSRVDLRRDGGFIFGPDCLRFGEPFELCGGFSGLGSELVEDMLNSVGKP